MLAGFIADDHEVTMIVVSDEKMGNAFASAAPSEWQDGDSAKPLVTKGGISFNAVSLRQSDQDESSNIALTAHELLHALGFTTGSKAFAAQVKNGKFTGVAAVKMNGGNPVPLSGSHFPQGFKDPVGVMPRMDDGGGDSYFSVLDLAVLADIGYDVPLIKDAKGPMFLNYKLYARHADKLSDGSFRMDGSGGNDTLYAGQGKFAIKGAGGNDILVSGDGTTEMEGDDHPQMPESYRKGKDGKDTFVVRKGAMVTITDLDPNDTVLISPEIGITKEDLDEAFKDPKKFINMPVEGNPRAFVPGRWLLQVGEYKIGIGTKDGKKPTNSDNIKIEDWHEE